MDRPIAVQRDVQAVQIPEGKQVLLPAGTACWVTQALGGTYTVQLATGRKLRIDGKDGDAIGQPVVTAESAGGAGGDGSTGPPATPEAAEKQAWYLMRQVHDPEIPVNVVDLGLVYTLKMHKRGDGKLLAEVRMSLTAPGCGMGDVLLEDVRRVLKTIPGVDTVDAKIVFDPIWNPGMMTDAAKLRLGLL